MRRPAPHRQILDLIRTIPPADCQNRLLRISDRDLGMALLYMSESERNRVLTLVGTNKTARVVQELERIERSRVDYRQYELSTSVVVRTLQGGTTTSPRSYYRPVSRARRPR